MQNGQREATQLGQANTDVVIVYYFLLHRLDARVLSTATGHGATAITVSSIVPASYSNHCDEQICSFFLLLDPV